MKSRKRENTKPSRTRRPTPTPRQLLPTLGCMRLTRADALMARGTPYSPRNWWGRISRVTLASPPECQVSPALPGVSELALPSPGVGIYVLFSQT